MLCKEYGITNYNVSTQSIENTNFANNFFDAVVAVSLLEFVPDLPKAINEIKRILKSDGVFITICPMGSKFLDFLFLCTQQKNPKKSLETQGRK